MKSIVSSLLCVIAIGGCFATTGCDQQQADQNLVDAAPTPKPGASVVVPVAPPGKPVSSDGAATAVLSESGGAGIQAAPK